MKKKFLSLSLSALVLMSVMLPVAEAKSHKHTYRYFVGAEHGGSASDPGVLSHHVKSKYKYSNDFAAFVGLVGGAMPVFDPERFAQQKITVKAQEDEIEKRDGKIEAQKGTHDTLLKTLEKVALEMLATVTGGKRVRPADVAVSLAQSVLDMEAKERAKTTAVNPDATREDSMGEGSRIFNEQDPKYDMKYREIKERMEEISKDKSLTDEEKKQRIDMYKSQINGFKNKMSMENRLDAGDYYGVRDDIHAYAVKMYGEQEQMHKEYADELTKLETEMTELIEAGHTQKSLEQREILLENYKRRIKDIRRKMQDVDTRVESTTKSIDRKEQNLEAKMTKRTGITTRIFDPYNPTEEDIDRGAKVPDMNKKLPTPF